jgi:hypothetical protein
MNLLAVATAALLPINAPPPPPSEPIQEYEVTAAQVEESWTDPEFVERTCSTYNEAISRIDRVVKAGLLRPEDGVWMKEAIQLWASAGTSLVFDNVHYTRAAIRTEMDFLESRC